MKRVSLLLSALVGTLGTGCLPQYLYETNAAPVEKTVALIESDPRVASALGSDVDVSLAVARVFDRDALMAARTGRDVVRLMTSVEGSRGEATLDLNATNIDEQGWVGTFSLRTTGRQVLQNGRYETVGGGTILAGTFAPDGSPLVVADE